MGNIDPKPKKCKGTGKASGHGCGKMQLKRTYGLGHGCGCYPNWLLNSDEGREKLNKSRITGKKKADKEEKRKRKEEKEALTDWGKKLQEKINEIVRLIDIGQPCLARGYHAKQIHAGHVFSRGSTPELRFNLHNIHRQSAQSNHFQNEDGLLREGLIKEYGKDYYMFLCRMRGIKALKYSNGEYREFYKKASAIALRLKKEGMVYSSMERIFKRDDINIELGIYPIEYCEYLKH